MQIAIDARIAGYTSGGIAQYARALAAHLPALDAANDYVILHARRAGADLPMPSNARRATCWTPAHHRLERWTLAAEVAFRKPRLLHATDFIPPRGGAWRVVITIHDLAFLRYPEFLTAASRRYYNDQIEAAVQRADAILADSEVTRQDILDRLPTTPESVMTVHLAQEARFRPTPNSEIAALRSRHGLPSEYILFVGAFEPRKNLPGLLNAYAQLDRAPPLVLAGNPGWLQRDIDTHIEALGLRKRVLQHSAFPAVDLPALYSGASVFVLPSHYEGFGLPVLEAMACGVPTVVANRASLPEIAAGAALLCNPDEAGSIAAALARALADSVLRSELIEKGFARAAQFSWEKCCRETLAVYRRVLGEP